LPPYKPANQALDARLSQILDQPNFPALAEHIQELMLRMQDEEITLRQVTNIILKDVGLSLRVLRTANSAHYNRSDRPILTIGHAVALMGLDAVRDLAATLLLLRHFRRSAPGVRHLLALSLLTANHARSAAALFGYRHYEEAYLCGMFRNLGEVLMACYFPKDYLAVLEDMKARKCAEKSSCRAVLGFTYEEMGQATILQWNMPDRVAASMRPPGPIRGPLGKEENILPALAAFAHELTTVMHRDPPEGLRGRMRKVLDLHGPNFQFRQRDIEWIAEQAIQETKSTFDMLQIPLDDLRLKTQMEQAIEMLKSGEGDWEHREDAAGNEEPERPGADLIEALKEEVSQVVSNGGFDLNQVLMMVVEAIQRGGGFSRVLFCLVTPDHSQIQARLGLGENIEELIQKFRFLLHGVSGPLGEAMIERRDLIVTQGLSLHSPFARGLGAGCFGIYPVVVDHVVAGCLYFDAEKPVKLNGSQRAALAGLRDLAVKAISITREAN
jgi:HD-like signal output (HDOD) protein